MKSLKQYHMQKSTTSEQLTRHIALICFKEGRIRHVVHGPVVLTVSDLCGAKTRRETTGSTGWDTAVAACWLLLMLHLFKDFTI